VGVISSPTPDRCHVGRLQFADLCRNHFKHPIDIFDYIGIPESKNSYSPTVKPLIARSVSASHSCMLTTVQLNSETQSGTKKIQNVGAGGMLPAKLGLTNLAIPQSIPESLFNIRLAAP
jgi:hypothetical protein